jgi:murein L,D-transpeptidase YcbB/YkuD
MKKITKPGILLLLILIALGCHNQRLIVGKPSELVSPAVLENDSYSKLDSLIIDTVRDKQVIADLLDDEANKVYHSFNYHLIWIHGGAISKQGRDLLEILANARKDGLKNSEYGYPNILLADTLLKTLGVKNLDFPLLVVRTDLMLTRAFLDYSQDLYSGRVNPALLADEWDITTRQMNFSALLIDAIRNNAVKQLIAALRPHNSQYYQLSKELLRLEAIASSVGWPQIPYFEKLRPGDTSIIIPLIRQYLSVTGYYSYLNANDSSCVYGADMELAIKKFQQRNGFTSDGVLGKDTRAAMLTPIEGRISQLQINMDRLRWLPDTLGFRYITVNIPEFKLRFYEGNKMVNDMRVIVGKIETSTPLLIDSIKYIVFSPEWNVPRSIAIKEMLPRLKSDPGYFSKNHFKIFKGKNEVQPDSVDWSEYDEDNFPFSLLQEPGKNNALGSIKFIFPNTQNIYLHGTPSGYLFGRDSRDMSHGCIRIERPGELAVWLLKNNKEFNKDSVQSYMNKETSKVISLRDRVPVYFFYQTAWVDEDGFLNFRKDIYGYDRIQIDLMKGLPNRRINLLQQNNHNDEIRIKTE